MPAPARQLLLRWGLLAAGLVLVLLGVLSRSEAERTWSRVWPVLLFLVLIKVLADLFDDAGLFDVAVHLAARAGRGSRLWLFLIFVGLCVVATNVLSLDTTAVLFTPLAIRLADELGLSRWPFALATLWLANTASLLLPVANLTNLIAQSRLALSTSGFIGALWLPQLGVLVVVVGALLLFQRRELRGRYRPPDVLPRPARTPLLTAALLTLALAVAVVAGTPPWLAALVALAVMVAVLAASRAQLLRPARLAALVPWSMTAFALGLFLVVTTLADRAASLLADLVGTGDSFPTLLAHAGAAAVGANGVNNLPAYLALEPFAPDRHQLLAVLIGVNVGPLVTAWGSLATLLWLHACDAEGLEVNRRPLALTGLVVALPAVLVGVGLLALT